MTSQVGSHFYIHIHKNLVNYLISSIVTTLLAMKHVYML